MKDLNREVYARLFLTPAMDPPSLRNEGVCLPPSLEDTAAIGAHADLLREHGVEHHAANGA